MHLAAAHHAEAVGGSGVLHLQSHILQQLFLQAVADLAAGDELALLAGKGAVVDREGHLNSGVVDLDEGQRLHKGGVAQGVADGDVGEAGEGHDVARLRGLDGGAAVGLEAVQGGDAAFHGEVMVVPVAHLHVLAHLDGAVLHAADADAAHKLVVVNAGAQHGHGRFGIAFGALHVLQDRLEQRFQVGAFHIGAVAGGAGAAGAEHHRAVQLLVGSAQVHQKQQDLVDDFLDAGVGTVDLVHGDDQAQVLLQGFLQHKAGLGHAALGGVHQQQHTVHHLQHALDLAAEVGMARGVDQVDLDVVVDAAAVFGQNGDAALTLDIARVHHALGHLLIVAERAALFQHLVDQGGLAVVNVRNDGNIAKIGTFHKIVALLYPFTPRRANAKILTILYYIKVSGRFLSMHRADKRKRAPAKRNV